LRPAERHIQESTRPAFEHLFLPERATITRKARDALAEDLPLWTGSLAQQTRRFEAWMAQRLSDELTPLSQEAVVIAADLVGQAEARIRRIIEALRDRIGRNICEATGITVSAAKWELQRPQVKVVPVAISQTLMTRWSLLSWMLPMAVIGGLFCRHVLGRVGWEVEPAARLRAVLLGRQVPKRRNRGGAGLGLAIAKGIVEAHHGTVSLDGTVGVGMTVEVRLPLMSAVLG
jgi:hypothetical protein